jgi:hypothetical protein
MEGWHPIYYGRMILKPILTLYYGCQPSMFIFYKDWDFPWNKPSSDRGLPPLMEPRIYLYFISLFSPSWTCTSLGLSWVDKNYNMKIPAAPATIIRNVDLPILSCWVGLNPLSSREELDWKPWQTFAFYAFLPSNDGFVMLCPNLGNRNSNTIQSQKRISTLGLATCLV